MTRATLPIALLLAACSERRPPAQEPHASSAASRATSTSSVSSGPASQTGRVRATDQMPPGCASAATLRQFADTLEKGRELGTGAVIFRQVRGSSAANPHSAAGVDTMTVRSVPAADAPALAHFLFGYVYDPHSMATCHALHRDPSASGPRLWRNAVTYSDYVLGLPADSLLADSSWARVAYAVGDDGTPFHGWVDIAGPVARYLDWPGVFARALQHHRLIFLRGRWVSAGDSSVFRQQPEGAPISIEIEPEPFRYHMLVQQFRGEWAEVVVMRGNPCDEEPEPERVPGTMWIRLVDDQKRPAAFLPAEFQC
jgi:hypothetical protein